MYRDASRTNNLVGDLNLACRVRCELPHGAAMIILSGVTDAKIAKAKRQGRIPSPKLPRLITIWTEAAAVKDANDATELPRPLPSGCCCELCWYCYILLQNYFGLSPECFQVSTAVILWSVLLYNSLSRNHCCSSTTAGARTIVRNFWALHIDFGYSSWLLRIKGTALPQCGNFQPEWQPHPRLEKSIQPFSSTTSPVHVDE